MRLIGQCILLGIALCAGRAEAAACCRSASTFGVGRLAIWEQAAVMVNATGSVGFGRWDASGTWSSSSAGTVENEWRAQVAGIGMLHEKVQVYGRAPLVMNQRAYYGQADFFGGLGDVLLGARGELLAIGEYTELPGVALSLGLNIPTGRATFDARRPMATDVTGRGSWDILVGSTFDWAQGQWYLQLGGGLVVPLPMRRPDTGSVQRYGLGLEAFAAGGWEFGEKLILSMVARVSKASWIRDCGPSPTSPQTCFVVPESDTFGVYLGPTIAWRVTPHWTVQGALEVPPFGTGFGDNIPGQLAMSLGIRHGFF
ncbi:MAG: hypothetical protein HYZ28_26140 [Myxococcales bacterium]|nr:hypothetical protein [Myxococcales bacterium]